ncbi:MAG: hypothetical protein IPK10_19860 [Bacteroidetes bacterium]|nr:hypothetical protein [Bacteroidota bacterium]
MFEFSELAKNKSTVDIFLGSIPISENWKVQEGNKEQTYKNIQSIMIQIIYFVQQQKDCPSHKLLNVNKPENFLHFAARITGFKTAGFFLATIKIL